MTKKEKERNRFLKLREEIPQETRVLRSIEMCRMLAQWEVLRKAYGVYTYMAFREEVTLLRLRDLLANEGIPFAVPRVEGEEMTFIEWTPNLSFSKSSFGILEPEDGKPVSWEKAVALVPGVAFDLQGNRLGYGKGYYDRYLKDHPELLRVGICFLEQVSEEPLAAEESDVKMQYLACPDRIIRI